jgi:CRP/FNR family transcriptional regulator, cyclic AMP receptor protein
MDSKVSIQIENFFQQYKSSNYKKREILIRAADEPVGVFYLSAGLVRQYAITSSGDELTINIFKPGSFFPMGWVFNDSISPHFFEASTSVTVWVAPKKDFLGFIQSEPKVLLDLIKRIYKGLDGYFMKMEHLMMGSAEERLIADLLIYARRFGQKVGNITEINFNLTGKDLAAQSGIARETVSRVIKRLKKKGLVKFEKNRISINDIQKLEEELLHI